MKIKLLGIVILALSADVFAEKYDLSEADNCTGHKPWGIDQAKIRGKVDLPEVVRQLLLKDMSMKAEALVHEPVEANEAEDLKEQYQHWISAYRTSTFLSPLDCFLDSYRSEDVIYRVYGNHFSGYVIERGAKPVSYILDHYVVAD